MVVQVSRLIWLLGLTACGEQGADGDIVQGFIGDYHGLYDGASWAYRDDAVTDASPREAEVLRARYTGEGLLDFRRGSRWPDAHTEATLRFDLGSFFTLESWDFAGFEGEATLKLGTSQPAGGQSVSGDSWFCRTSLEEEVSTYYGVFLETVKYSCEGSAGPAGSFIFAKDIGLVYFESEDYVLDLIAPW